MDDNGQERVHFWGMQWCGGGISCTWRDGEGAVVHSSGDVVWGGWASGLYRLFILSAPASLMNHKRGRIRGTPLRPTLLRTPSLNTYATLGSNCLRGPGCVGGRSALKATAAGFAYPSEAGAADERVLSGVGGGGRSIAPISVALHHAVLLCSVVRVASACRIHARGAGGRVSAAVACHLGRWAFGASLSNRAVAMGVGSTPALSVLSACAPTCRTPA